MLLPPRNLPAAGFARPWPPVLVTWGPGTASAAHAHHCWHLVLARDGELQVTASDRALTTGAVLVRPDVEHAIDATGRAVVVVFVEPESELGERLGAAFADDVQGFELATVASLRNAVPTPIAIEQVIEVLGLPAAPPVPRHPGVRRAVRFAKEAVDADLSLEALARVAKLSPGRFMHAFTESMGLPLRPWLRWLRLERAAVAIAGGIPLSEAALAAGFSDAAHMTRTFREMFGVTPSELRRGSQSVQDPETVEPHA